MSSRPFISGIAKSVMIKSGRPDSNLSKSFDAIVSRQNLIPAALQRCAKHANNLTLIINDENAFQCLSWVTIWRSTLGASDMNF